MSGHSKWSTIKRQKGVVDQKRGQIFTKLSNTITMAVKQGGGVSDPDQNFRLRLAIDAAKRANMPKENIERAISRARGKQADSLEEVVYEGFGPHSISVIVEAATDNRARTTSEVKNVFEKNGGAMGQPGSVTYQFKQLGAVTMQKDSKTLEDIFLLAAESGAKDVEEEDEVFIIYTQPADLAIVTQKLRELAALPIESSELVWKPALQVPLESEEDIEKVITFVDKLEDLSDVQRVYTNIA